MRFIDGPRRGLLIPLIGLGIFTGSMVYMRENYNKNAEDNEVHQVLEEKPVNNPAKVEKKAVEPEPVKLAPKVEKLPYEERDGIKYDTVLAELKSVKLVDVTSGTMEYSWNNTAATFNFYMPVFQTADGYKILGYNFPYGFARGLIYNVRYEKFYDPKSVTKDQLFHRFVKTENKLIVGGQNLTGIEGIITKIELVNQK